jgi:hypothetical protein
MKPNTPGTRIKSFKDSRREGIEMLGFCVKKFKNVRGHDTDKATKALLAA